MSHLSLKIRIIGKKNQEFSRFIVVPKAHRQRGKYFTSLGYWDTRLNQATRFIAINLLSIMLYRYYGMTINKKSLHIIFTYLADFKRAQHWDYYKEFQLKQSIENEIKAKYQK